MCTRGEQSGVGGCALCELILPGLVTMSNKEMVSAETGQSDMTPILVLFVFFVQSKLLLFGVQIRL